MLNSGRWSGRDRGFPAHGCPISETPVWEVVKDCMMLNQPVVPEDDGIRLPLHSDLRRNAGADGVKKKPKQELGFGFGEPIDATGESFIHIQRYIPCFRNLPHNGVMTGR